MAQGHIVQCIGVVVDIQFPRDAMPKVYDALVLEESGDSLAEKGLTFEVQQQLGDSIVHTIAMGSSKQIMKLIQKEKYFLLRKLKRKSAELTE